MDFVFHYQGLIGSVLSGVFTLAAGALIFIEGKRQIAQQKRIREEETNRRETIATSIAVGLKNHLFFMSENHTEAEVLRDEYVEAFGQVDDIQPPKPETGYAALNLHLNQLSSYPELQDAVFRLYHLIREIEIYEVEFGKFKETFLRTQQAFERTVAEMFPDPKRDKHLKEVDENVAIAAENVSQSYLDLIELLDQWIEIRKPELANASNVSTTPEVAGRVIEREPQE